MCPDFFATLSQHAVCQSPNFWYIYCYCVCNNTVCMGGLRRACCVENGDVVKILFWSCMLYKYILISCCIKMLSCVCVNIYINTIL